MTIPELVNLLDKSIEELNNPQKGKLESTKCRYLNIVVDLKKKNCAVFALSDDYRHR